MMKKIQYKGLKFVFNNFKCDYSVLLKNAGLSILELSANKAITLVLKSIHKMSPSFMLDLHTLIPDIPHN